MKLTTGVIVAAMAALVIVAQGCTSVQDEWTWAQNTNTIESYEQFISAHPKSEFDAVARERIAELRDWEAIEAKPSRAAYEDFLKRHPEGQFAPRALAGIQIEQNFVTGMSRLRKGMTPAEVSGEIGSSFGSLLPITGKVTFPNGHSVSFLDGKLDAWE